MRLGVEEVLAEIPRMNGGALAAAWVSFPDSGSRPALRLTFCRPNGRPVFVDVWSSELERLEEIVQIARIKWHEDERARVLRARCNEVIERKNER